MLLSFPKQKETVLFADITVLTKEPQAVKIH